MGFKQRLLRAYKSTDSRFSFTGAITHVSLYVNGNCPKWCHMEGEMNVRKLKSGVYFSNFTELAENLEISVIYCFNRKLLLHFGRYFCGKLWQNVQYFVDHLSLHWRGGTVTWQKGKDIQKLTSSFTKKLHEFPVYRYCYFRSPKFCLKKISHQRCNRSRTLAHRPISARLWLCSDAKLRSIGSSHSSRSLRPPFSALCLWNSDLNADFKSPALNTAFPESLISCSWLIIESTETFLQLVPASFCLSEGRSAISLMETGAISCNFEVLKIFGS